MTQPTPVDPATPPAAPVAPVVPQQPTAPVPPWERDGTPFDPARAWALIQNKDNDAAQLKARVAVLEPLEAAAKAAEEANKTELQRAQEAATAAQKDAQEARLALLRRDVANRDGKVLPAGLADRLRGNTKEELEADADALLATFPQAPAAPPGTTPVAALRPTTLPQAPALSVDDQIAAATKDGNWRLVLQLQNQKLATAAGQ